MVLPSNRAITAIATFDSLVTGPVLFYRTGYLETGTVQPGYVYNAELRSLRINFQGNTNVKLSLWLQDENDNVYWLRKGLSVTPNTASIDLLDKLFGGSTIQIGANLDIWLTIDNPSSLAGSSYLTVIGTFQETGLPNTGTDEPIAVINGGTGLTFVQPQALLLGAGSNPLSPLPVGSDGQWLSTISGVVTWTDLPEGAVVDDASVSAAIRFYRGTNPPSNPQVEDRWFEMGTADITWFWTGSRWESLHVETFTFLNDALTADLTVNIPLTRQYDLRVLGAHVAGYLGGTTINAANSWGVTLSTLDNQNAVLTQIATGTYTSIQDGVHLSWDSPSFDLPCKTLTARGIRVVIDETGAPSALSRSSIIIRYRLIR